MNSSPFNSLRISSNFPIASVLSEKAAAFKALIILSAIILLICACVGFLPHNVTPAKSFLGDAGSMLLGFMLAAFSINEFFTLTVENTRLSALTPIALLAIPIFDTCFAIIRRKASGQRIFEGDKKHVHHRLSDRYGQKMAVIILYGVCAVLVGIAILLNTGLWGELIGAVLLIAMLGYAIFRFGICKK